jgi:diguanylate cyclase (GGDEF)-like protein/PAS domain S-box-containing protein
MSDNSDHKSNTKTLQAQVEALTQEVAQLKEAELELREAGERWRQLSNASYEAVLLIEDNKVKDVNSAAALLFHYSVEEMCGLKVASLFRNEADEIFARYFELELTRPIDIDAKTKSNSVFHAEIRLRIIKTERAKSFLLVVRDITTQKLQEKKLIQLANFDPLTHLPNRATFFNHAQSVLSRSKRRVRKHALLFIDLDNFKHINDSLGHAIGDELLIEMGQRLTDANRQDAFLARLGGDEFAIFVEDIADTITPAKVAKRLLETLEDPFELLGHSVVVTPSIGISIYPSDGDDITDLMKNADTAMYHAKNIGRNTYQFFIEDMNEAATKRLKLESQLRQAIQNSIYEFKVVFQPKAKLPNKDYYGAEVLVRWHQADGQIIPPNDFIPIAEETGLITELGEHVLRQACTLGAKWLAEGKQLGTLAVNLSPKQFNQEDLVSQVERVLADTGFPAELLELEITESAVIDNSLLVTTLMSSLKAKNITMALDDFGTGYSSLAMLRQFPLDILKLDRSFIMSMSDPKDAKLVEDIISLAHHLALDVVAEGIEEDAQVSALTKMGCNAIQGYLFSKPLSEEDFSSFISNIKESPLTEAT